MKLGLDSYTLRWQGWDAIQLIEYCAEIGVDAVQLSGRGHFRSLSRADLLPAKQRAEERGVVIELSMGSIDKHSSSFNADHGAAEEQLRAMLDAAAFLNSPSLRVILGGAADRRGPVPLADHVDECIRVLKGAKREAIDLGVKIAFENHGDLLASGLIELVERAGPEHVGVCLDSGQPATMAEDPNEAIALLAPYMVTGHIRDTRVWAHEAGAMFQHVPMGQGVVDWPRAVSLMPHDAIFSLEILTGRPPRLIPYLDPTAEFWQAFPDRHVSNLAPFIQLAHRHAPEPYPQLEVPDERSPSPEAIAQQRRHFEESVRYCREVLGLGG